MVGEEQERLLQPRASSCLGHLVADYSYTTGQHARGHTSHGRTFEKRAFVTVLRKGCGEQSTMEASNWLRACGEYLPSIRQVSLFLSH